ncbi:hypothetical protein [Foetidibacter luteolus]|uniref:hypothetical protein n=1 Tax=Foetidibacter luteolus TaxID=2608880 RepID=UPI00129AF6F1|nr:hypothetical protein [Foetidibacter luteolus]
MNKTVKELLKDAYNILSHPAVLAAAERVAGPYDKKARAVADELETYLVMACDGVDAIAKARTEQIVKHSYTLSHDVKHNVAGTLVTAAIALLQENPSDFPDDWNRARIARMLAKDELGRIAHAGGFLAAEYARLKFITETAEDNE